LFISVDDLETLHTVIAQISTHIVDSCPVTKRNGGLQRLHIADKAAVDWLTFATHRSIQNK